ncbi:hypothetical protein [Enemella sp. A6]|uniref:hypothetical protein n=1 Tax=Enemella sp. A6 TaxID=3440152 RepID=UPI003EBD9D7D
MRYDTTTLNYEEPFWPYSMATYQASVLDESCAGEILTLQRAAYITEAIAHQDLALPPLTQTLGELHDDLWPGPRSSRSASASLGVWWVRFDCVGSVRLLSWAG